MSCNAGLVVMNSLNFFLSGKLISFLQFWMIALLGRVILVVGFYHFEYFMPFPSGLQRFCWKFSWQSYGSFLEHTNCFSISIFKILSLSLTIAILIMIHLGVGLLGFILFETMHSWTWMFIFFTRLGKLSVIIFSERFLIIFSPSATPMMRLLRHLMLFQQPLKLTSF